MFSWKVFLNWNKKDKKDKKYKNDAIKYRELATQNNDSLIKKLQKKLEKRDVVNYCITKVRKELEKKSKKGEYSVDVEIKMKEFNSSNFGQTPSYQNGEFLENIKEELKKMGYNHIPNGSITFNDRRVYFCNKEYNIRVLHVCFNSQNSIVGTCSTCDNIVNYTKGPVTISAIYENDNEYCEPCLQMEILKVLSKLPETIPEECLDIMRDYFISGGGNRYRNYLNGRGMPLRRRDANDENDVLIIN